MQRHDRIEINPKIMGGIRGTRITLEHILRTLGGSMTPEQLLGDHLRLTVDSGSIAGS